MPKIALPLTLLYMTLSLLPNQIQAQSELGKPATIYSITFEPPNTGEPKDTTSGATRGPGRCSEDLEAAKPYVTPLLPATHYGLTTEEHPTIFVYVPPSIQKVFFSLHDQNNNSRYQTTLFIPAPPGVVSFKLPAAAPALEVGNSYKWYFVLMCGNALKPDSPRVEGWVRRVKLNPTLTSQLENAVPIKRAALYGSAGIWYDTLTVLAELRQSQSDDLVAATMWRKLLSSVGLGAIATEPLIKHNPHEIARK